jgi:hypothetical protein
MEYGAHLPLIEFDAAPPTLADLRAYVRRAAALELAATIDAGAEMTKLRQLELFREAVVPLVAAA